ncbi:MAG: adenylosuccinate synthase [Acidobacteriota bacterium]
MANVVIIGMQWGDEGKGKVVDLVGPAFDVVARYQGGHNAGHTVRFGDEHFSLHLIPSGILRPGVQCVLGNGMVIDPDAFFRELRQLESSGVSAEGRLLISNRAHVVLPSAVALDQARESARGDAKIGTTSRGIGPTYEAKVSRVGLRIYDLGAPHLEERLRFLLGRADAELRSLGHEGPEGPNRVADLCRSWWQELRPYVQDTELRLNQWLDEGKSVLFEGAQGTLLDVDHGTYPYVTSSNSTAGGAAIGSGVPPTALDGAMGVLKAYTTRVGSGPFATEISGETEAFLRERGNEFGTTTGRPRRCGWLDLVACRYARRVNGIDAIALTKLDVLDQLPEIPVCVGYRLRGTLYREYGTVFEAGEGFQPEYRIFKGWQQDTSGILTYEDLPAPARDYIDFLEQELSTPIAMVSTGPRREETIVRDLPILRELMGGQLPTVPAA